MFFFLFHLPLRAEKSTTISLGDQSLALCSADFGKFTIWRSSCEQEERHIRSAEPSHLGVFSRLTRQ